MRQTLAERAVETGAAPGTPSEPARPSLVGALRRRGWVVIAAALGTTLVAWALASIVPQTYRAEAIAQVPSGAQGGQPGDATDARALALSYAALIPDDPRVAGRVAAATGTTVASAHEQIAVLNPVDTAVLQLRVTAEDPARARAGTRALLTAVTNGDPAASAVAPGSLQAVRGPEPAVAATPLHPSTAVPLGLVLGLALGIVLLLAWERADPVVDGPATVRAELGTPAIDVTRIAPGTLAAIMKRWQRLGRPPWTGVVILPVDGPVATAPDALAERLAATARGAGIAAGVWPQAIADGGAERDQPELCLVPLRPGADWAREQPVAASCDAAVLVVPQGAPLSRLRAERARVEDIGLRVECVLLTAPGAAGSWTDPTGRRHGDARRAASAGWMRLTLVLGACVALGILLGVAITGA